MRISTVSEKGQITLPASFRKKLGIRPHDRVVIEGDERAIVIRPAPDIFQFEGFLGKGLSPTEERRRMMKGVSDHVLGTRK